MLRKFAKQVRSCVASMRVLAAVALLLLVSVMTSNAALDASITGAVTDLSGLWDTVFAVVVAIAVGLAAVRILKRITR